MEYYLIDCLGLTNTMALEMNPMDTNYNAWRNILKYKLKIIDSCLKNRDNFNHINLLFHHIWQIKQQRNDKIREQKSATVQIVEHLFLTN